MRRGLGDGVRGVCVELWRRGRETRGGVARWRWLRLGVQRKVENSDDWIACRGMRSKRAGLGAHVYGLRYTACCRAAPNEGGTFSTWLGPTASGLVPQWACVRRLWMRRLTRGGWGSAKPGDAGGESAAGQLRSPRHHSSVTQRGLLQLREWGDSMRALFE